MADLSGDLAGVKTLILRHLQELAAGPAGAGLQVLDVPRLIRPSGSDDAADAAAGALQALALKRQRPASCGSDVAALLQNFQRAAPRP